MAKLRVVAVGGWGHAGTVFDELAPLDEAEFCAYAPAHPGEDMDLVTNHAICTPQSRSFDDYPTMFAEIQPDLVIVSTRLDHIPRVIIAAAEAGAHVIAEKPLALDHATLAQVAQTVKANGVQLLAMLSMRSHPAFLAARAAYQSGLIGAIVLANGRKSYKWGVRPDWFGSRETYGSTIGWVGIHAVDFINFITDLRYTAVAAMVGNQAHPERPACEDNCALTLQLENGAHATVSIDYFRPAAAPTHGDDWVRLVGTKGVLEANASQLWCQLINDDGAHELTLPTEPDAMYRRFFLSLLGQDTYENATETSLMLTQTCLHAKDAADQQTVIQIP